MHLILLVLILQTTVFDEEYKSWSSFLYNILYPPVTFFFSGPITIASLTPYS
jgi:hypothetical protein